MPGPSVFPSGEPGVSGDFWASLNSSVGKESACSARDPSLIPGLGRSAGEGIGYPSQWPPPLALGLGTWGISSWLPPLALVKPERHRMVGFFCPSLHFPFLERPLTTHETPPDPASCHGLLPSWVI